MEYRNLQLTGETYRPQQHSYAWH